MEGEAIIWFVIGLALVLSEFILPGIILVFFGIAAILVSLLVYIGLIETLNGQLIVFLILSLALLFGLRHFFKGWFVGKTRHAVDGEGEIDRDEFIGKETKVVEAIDGKGGYGKIEFKGANWKAACDSSLNVGDLVEITRRDGLTVHVRPKN